MYILEKGNIVRYVPTLSARDKLIKEGYKPKPAKKPVKKPEKKPEG